MPNFDEVRRAARQSVHETFGRAATYYGYPTLGPGSPVTVRLHNRQFIGGDLDREGFPQMVSEVDRLVFSVEEVTQYNVTAKGLVELDDGRMFRLALKRPAIDTFSVEFDVTKVQA